MGTVRKTITLTDKQDIWIKAQIDAGRYTNDSECIRDLIRKEQERAPEPMRAVSAEGESLPFEAGADRKAMPGLLD